MTPIHTTFVQSERQFTFTLVKPRTGDNPGPVFEVCMPHYHHCPVCYEHWSCQYSCTIEPDLEDNGKQFGAHCTCKSCEDMISHEKIFYSTDKFKYGTKEFWDVYNGFVKVRKQ